jgi:hypothetical protein
VNFSFENVKKSHGDKLGEYDVHFITFIVPKFTTLKVQFGKLYCHDAESIRLVKVLIMFNERTAINIPNSEGIGPSYGSSTLQSPVQCLSIDSI